MVTIECVDDQGERIEFDGAGTFCDCFLGTPGDAEQLRVSDVAKTPICIEFDGTFCFPFRAGPVPVIPSVNEGQGSMRLRQRLIELQCFGCCSLSLRKRVLRRYFTCWREASISIG